MQSIFQQLRSTNLRVAIRRVVLGKLLCIISLVSNFELSDIMVTKTFPLNIKACEASLFTCKT